MEYYLTYYNYCLQGYTKILKTIETIENSNQLIITLQMTNGWTNVNVTHLNIYSNNIKQLILNGHFIKAWKQFKLMRKLYKSFIYMQTNLISLTSQLYESITKEEKELLEEEKNKLPVIKGFKE